MHKFMLKKITVSFQLYLYKTSSLPGDNKQSLTRQQSYPEPVPTLHHKNKEENYPQVPLWVKKLLHSKPDNRILTLAENQGTHEKYIKSYSFSGKLFVQTTAKSNTDRKITSELQHFLKSFHCFKYVLQNK